MKVGHVNTMIRGSDVADPKDGEGVRACVCVRVKINE